MLAHKDTIPCHELDINYSRSLRVWWAWAWKLGLVWMLLNGSADFLSSPQNFSFESILKPNYGNLGWLVITLGTFASLGFLKLAISQTYGRFKVQLQREETMYPPLTLTLQELLIVWWAHTWRTLLTGVAISAAITYAAMKSSINLSLFLQPLEAQIVAGLIHTIISVFFFRIILRKRYTTFSFIMLSV